MTERGKHTVTQGWGGGLGANCMRTA
jgi:hypothetical protein